MTTETRTSPDPGDGIDPRMFRSVLGHFPTGVVVVTAIGADGDPIGMVVGSFTSVSLDPPLVAFLPSRTSASYQRLRASDRFCVNVLGEQQEDLCRRFASKEARKFDGVGWAAAPGGSPILDGAVAWIDCRHEVRHEAGDHDIVVGRVTALGAHTATGPLLFFQGGYGRFDAGALAAPYSADLRAQLQVADVSRPHLERLAAATGLEAYAQAVVDDDLVIVAASGSPGRSVRTHIGRRLPLKRPYGATFPAFEPEREPSWIAGEPSAESAAAPDAGAAARLDRVRRRGWSIGLVAPQHDEHWSTIAQHGEPHPPAADARIASALAGIAGAYEPDDEVLEGDELDVRILSAPVVGASGAVVQSVALFGFPPGARADTVREWAHQVVATAEDISAELLSA
ncbi:flavin reductase [Herbiconiux sp. P17]|uniref:flavin reductase n=1 Tax=Herbiconiux wuyangfengii TaxID=3342794 RepID=UPI0035B90399